MKEAMKRVGNKLVKVLAFALMAVTVFVGGFTTSELLRKEEAPQIEGVHTGNSLQAEQTTNNGISLMAADGSSYVEDTLGQSVPYGALKVTATVTPATAKNQQLTWDCVWAGTDSSWSSGKTVSDYFKLEYIGTNAHEIYVWATQPYGDQVIVTATSTDGTNKKSTMTVDFAKRMTGVTFESFGDFDYDEGIYYDVIGVEDPYQSATVKEVDFIGSYGSGSKDLTWELVDYGVNFNQEYQEAVNTVQTFVYIPVASWSAKAEGGFDQYAYNIFPYEDSNHQFFDGSDTAVYNRNRLIDCIIEVNGYIGDLYFKFESVETDSFGDKYSYYIEYEIIIGEEYLGLTVENVNLSDSTLTF